MIASDGDLQEGIASEAGSLAGHLRLGKLIVCYDDNHIQLDGPTAMAWSEDVLERFDAYGWHTQRVEDGNDLAAIEAAVTAARADDRPSLIAVRTHIGYGQPEQAGLARRRTAHRSGPTRSAWSRRPTAGTRTGASSSRPRRSAVFRAAIKDGEALVAGWEARFEAYAEAHPELAAEFRRRIAGDLAPAGMRTSRRTRPGPRWPPGTPARTPSRPSPRACRSCSAARPTCRSRT